MNCGEPTIFDRATSYITPVFHRSAVRFCDGFLKIFWPSPSKWLKTTTHHLNSKLRSQDNTSETQVCRAMFQDLLATGPTKTAAYHATAVILQGANINKFITSWGP